MPGMRDEFAHFYAPRDDDIAAAMKTALVVPDTNVLLNLYRFQEAARDELFGALEKTGDRLWIPHQVGLEFHRNRLGVMKEQEEYFAKTRAELDKSIQDFGERVQAFKRRLSLGDEHVKAARDALAVLENSVKDVADRASGLNTVRLGDHASDAVLERIDRLFANKKSVGGPMEPGKLKAAREEAERRGKEKIPPGYQDRSKTRGDPAGDYIVWRQIMTEAVSRKVPVIFVTDDVKDDWYQREYGLTLGARRELREEMMHEAGTALLIMTTEAFLRHARTHLKAVVSEQTVDQAKDLPRELPPSAAFESFIEFRSELVRKYEEIARESAERLIREQTDEVSRYTIAGGTVDQVLQRIAIGRFGDSRLAHAMEFLRTRLDAAEMTKGLIEAVNFGLQSGMLSQERAEAVMAALTSCLQDEPSYETRPRAATAEEAAEGTR